MEGGRSRRRRQAEAGTGRRSLGSSSVRRSRQRAQHGKPLRGWRSAHIRGRSAGCWRPQRSGGRNRSRRNGERNDGASSLSRTASNCLVRIPFPNVLSAIPGFEDVGAGPVTRHPQNTSAPGTSVPSSVVARMNILVRRNSARSTVHGTYVPDLTDLTVPSISCISATRYE